MKTFTSMLLIVSGILLFTCSKDVPKADDATRIRNIHFGSYHNTLSGVAVMWRNNSKSDSIRWGYSAQFEKGRYPAKQSDNYKNFTFEYDFPVLNAADTVFYSLYDSQISQWTTTSIFKTGSDTTHNNFSFTFVGDSRTNLDDWMLVSGNIQASDFCLFLGDITSDGKEGYYWDEWYQHGATFLGKTLVFHTYGNHDVGPYYEKQFALPGNKYYYSFIEGNVLFICLNSEDPGNITQYNWLKSTLESYKNMTWKVVYFHKPFYTNNIELKQCFSTWWKTFDDYGVDLILNGHTHNYQRTKPINRNIDTLNPVASYGSGADQGRCQIIAGGAGAPLSKLTMNWYTKLGTISYHYCIAEVNGNTMKIKAVDMTGNIIDSFTLSK